MTTNPYVRRFLLFFICLIQVTVHVRTVSAQTLSLSDPETWLGHQGTVTSLAFAPDGRSFVSGGMDNVVKQWNWEQRSEQGVLRGHIGPVWTVAYTPDGASILSGSEDKTIRIWDAVTFGMTSTVPMRAPVLSAAVSPDRLWLVGASSDKQATLWNYRLPGYATPLPEPTDLMAHIRFIPEDNLLAVPTASQKVLLWDPALKETVGELSGASSPIAVSADGRWLASGSGKDDTVLLWDLQQRSMVATFKGHLGLVASLQFSSDGRWLVSGSWDHTIRIWDIERRRMALVRDEERPVWAVAFSPDGKNVVAGEEDGILRRWRLQTATPPVASRGGTGGTARPAPVTSARGVDQAPITSMRRPEALGVIFGVEDYRYAPSVTFARNDATVMRDYFIKTLGLNEANVYVRMDRDATQGEFRKVFDPAQGWLAKRITPGVSEVFVYYVGHGAPDISTGDAFLMPADGDPNYPATSYRIAELYRSLEQLPAKRVTIVLDACFSGRAGRGRQVEPLMAGTRGIGVEPRLARPGENTVVLTASGGNQVSSGYPEKSHGLFTYFLLKGLQGEADANGDRRVTMQELFLYVRQHVSNEAGRLDREQTPELQGLCLDEPLVIY